MEILITLNRKDIERMVETQFVREYAVFSNNAMNFKWNSEGCVVNIFNEIPVNVRNVMGVFGGQVPPMDSAGVPMYINGIKMIREQTGWDLKTAKDRMDEYMVFFGWQRDSQRGYWTRANR